MRHLRGIRYLTEDQVLELVGIPFTFKDVSQTGSALMPPVLLHSIGDLEGLHQAVVRSLMQKSLHPSSTLQSVEERVLMVMEDMADAKGVGVVDVQQALEADPVAREKIWNKDINLFSVLRQIVMKFGFAEQASFHMFAASLFRSDILVSHYSESKPSD